jgi:signal transduction histidine kinase
MSAKFERRILVIDDDPTVREAYRKVLCGVRAGDGELADTRSALFDDVPTAPALRTFHVAFADNGKAAIDTLSADLACGASFAMAFLDMRMPPGPDGLATAKELWRLDPDLQIVLCTAYSDCSWDSVLAALGHTDRLLILKKPFDPVEAQQMAEALCAKRRLLEELRARGRDLEVRVEARTRELSQALRIAEAATRAKSEFLANMSHEIRTPMTAILGFTECLRDPGLAVEEREAQLDIIRRNGDHLLTVLNDILDLSKIEAGQMLVEAVEVDMPALLSEIASLMRVRAAAKGLSFELVYQTPVPERVTTDPTRLRQILLNLIGNGIKFTERGGVQLRISTLDPANDTARLRVAVEDSGIGIAPERLEQLFRAFAQGDSSTSRRFGGTGLGLVISQRLARLLGGEVGFTGSPGGGSTFTVTIPTGSLAGVRMLTRASEAVARCKPHLTELDERLSGRVLLAEDGLDNQRLISLILKRVGAEVVVAGNGQVACELAERSRAEGRPFDLILLDMQMPVMDGHDAARALRQVGWNGPIIALTANAMAGDRERCIEAGCDGYETKPVQRERLIATCRQALGRALGPRSDVAPLPHDDRKSA